MKDYQILKYLEGRGSDELRSEVDIWRESSEENQKELDWSTEIWNNVDKVSDYVQEDVDAQWAMFESSISC